MGKVMRTTHFVAFVELLPARRLDAYLAIKEMKNVEDVVKVGDDIIVKVTDIDRQGRVSFS